MFVDLSQSRRTLGTFIRILLLLVIVGVVLPRVALLTSNLLSLPRMDGEHELRFQENVQRVTGFTYVGNLDWMERVEVWYRDLATRLRRYYYDRR